ncbi:MAG TPA: hypothetical protein VFM18_08735 [Methanosarcina sp.]|nr:hypothetical protein [Methanosarcina sp.]
MSLTTNENDKLSTSPTGFTAGWDWKGSYVEGLNDSEGLERFSQFSATPDTTLLYASSARFTSVDPSTLTPIGLADNISFASNPMLARLFEIGSNRSFFTRGKTTNSLQLSRMLADQDNVLEALSKNAYRPALATAGMSAPGADAPNPGIKMNLDSEYFNVPFGLLIVFKTRGGGDDGYGKALSAVYLEYCMFSNFQFGIASQSPVIQENVAIEFDRVVPVSLN